MDLSFSDTEQTLASIVRDFVRRAAPKDVLVGLQSEQAPSPRDWAEAMAAAGWLGLLIPDESGGSGATPMEAAMFFQEIGRAPLPPSWLLSGGVSTPLIAAASASESRTAALMDLATGKSIVVPGLQTAGTRWSGVTPIESGPTLSTELTYVCGLREATHVLVPLSMGGEQSLAVVPADHAAVSRRPLMGFLTDCYAVSIAGLELSSIRLIPCRSHDLDSALALAATMVSAFQVGSCERLLEIAVAHANDRVQFGQLIGAFQRVQDHIVRIVNALDSARWLLYDALASTDSDRFEAKAWMARAAAIAAHWECADAAHEVLAGVGSDPAHGTILHTAMSRLLHAIFGSPAYCRRRHAEAEGWLSGAAG
jgi:alkylation response protein AidB-like acyl-CoA dehydrogenase